MKVMLGLLAALLVFLLLVPLWGWMGVLTYGGIEWLGQRGSTGLLSDGRLGFRAGVMLGGGMAVLSFLWVAWKDRSISYLLAGVFVGLGFVVLLVVTGVGPAQVAPQRSGPKEVWVESPGPRRLPVRREWQNRRAYEHDVARQVETIARAAARGELAQADTLLDTLESWPMQRPRAQEQSGQARLAWKAYIDHYTAPAGAAGAATERGGGSGKRQARERAVLQALWSIDPRATGAATQLLLGDVEQLRVDMDAARGTRGREAGAEALRGLEGIRTGLEALFAYIPASAPLWDSYASLQADTDEELALGAWVMASRLGRGRPTRTDGLDDTAATQRPMADVDLWRLAGRLPAADNGRRGILRARAAMVRAQHERLPFEEAPGGGADGKVGLSKRALPPAGLVVLGEGLRLPLPEPSAPATEQGLGEVQADLGAAGFMPGDTHIQLQAPVRRWAQLLLAVDVWEGGQVTSVLVERSSGDPALDEAARRGAAYWRAAGKVAAAGERRRVAVVFQPPAAGAGPLAPPPPMVPMMPEDRVYAELLGQARGIQSMPADSAGGTVVLTVAVGPDGRVRSASVTRSSGQPRLDAAVRRAALGWEVSPTAIARSGPVTVEIPIRFETL